MNRHEITVTGVTGSGKTNIAALIASALDQEGIETTYEGLDFESTEDLLAWADGHSSIDRLKELGVKIRLVERQAPRREP